MSATQDQSLEALLQYIKDSRGFDFTGYKRPSLVRRITKRMQSIGVDEPGDYLVYLEAHPDEYAALFDTILINVTAFFRDPAAWEYLRSEIIPRLAAARRPDEDIRVWVPGCATGEEAFTVAMLLAEELGEDRFRSTVKIYATDVDEAALTTGRHARYSPKSLEGVPKDLRTKYFELNDSGSAFRADLRRTVIFGRHDLVQDPPISRIDLLVARNTLMYFLPETQAQILASFHFALRADGFLFLGKSEVLLTRSNLFVPVEIRHRVFVKTPQGAMSRLRQIVDDPPLAGPREATDQRLRAAAFDSVPVAELAVDLNGRLGLANVQARAMFSLTQKDTGRPLQDLELSYRPVELRSLIERARAERHQVSLRDVAWRTGDEVRYIDVQVAPLTAADGAAVGVGITFSDVTRYRRLQQSLEDANAKLETAFEELQSTAEELETTNEELQSTNEELETTNEELQSTNEELETMNEELQSTNEELETMNDEFRQRTLEVHEINAFLESILISLQTAVVVVDGDLRIAAWNERAWDLWGLRAEEVHGQHLANLEIGLPVDEVLPAVRATAAGQQVDELRIDATDRRGRGFTCRVTCSQLLSPTREVRGVIVLMESTSDTS